MATRTQSVAFESSGVSECLDRLAARKGQDRPLATYRLQFNRDFTFQQARALVPYLAALGISHCYASPILKARSGSAHGYDITDHNALNPEIGTEEDFRALVAELKAHGMGLVLDIVPNHMGVGPGTNPWWQDVLENGRSSEYADFFDVDWEPLREELHGKVLLPILGSQYGEVLEKGEIKLVYEDARFSLDYYDKRLPIDPQTLPLIFEPLRVIGWPEGDADIAEMEALLAAFGNLPHRDEEDSTAVARRRTIAELLARWAQLAGRSAQVRELIARALKLINGTPGDARSFAALHRLLEAQAYRPAHWRVSAEEINYRRFFDINDLIGVRMENPRVFAATHRLLRRLLGENCITGLRVDHPDGLLNPAQYFVRLQMLYGASQCCGPEPRGVLAENGIEREIQDAFGEHDWIATRPPMYVAVEKILESGEELPAWPVDGTVGYDFLNLLNGIFIQTANRRAFTTLFRRFTGVTIDVPTLIYESKKLILDIAMSGEVNVLTHLLAEVSSTDRRARDFTRKALSDAIRETVACFPVYRTYIDERGTISERDRQYINEAIVRAKRRNEAMAAAAFEFLRDVLLLAGRQSMTADSHRRRLYFTLKFQQLTGPVMAKGLEDTACYVYNRLVSVNEVGGSPAQFGVNADEFHRANMVRAQRWPNSMLATSTHDTKRGEDVRARINVLSEMPSDWSRGVLRWRRMNRSQKRVLGDGRSVPDSNEEYLLYQTLVGMWPLVTDSNATNAQLDDEWLVRVRAYMTKAIHEAKVNLSWINQNPEYVAALEEFITRVLRPESRRKSGRAGDRRAAFAQDFAAFVQPVQLFGACNSLAQTLLKLTSPGAPDVYQGTELWDFSLVDPDNRRPVGYELRQRFTQQLTERAEADGLLALCRELLREWPDGRVKLWITLRALACRRAHPELFQLGSYTPLYAAVEKEQHIVAFARVHERQMAIVAVPRLSYTLMRGEPAFPLGEAWAQAELVLPPRTANEFENVLTGEVLRGSPARSLLCREVFGNFPVALLVGKELSAAR